MLKNSYIVLPHGAVELPTMPLAILYIPVRVRSGEKRKKSTAACCVSDCIGLTSGDRGGAPPPHLSMCCHRLSRPRWPSEHAATRRGRADRRGASLLPAGGTFAVPIAPAGRSFAGRRGASPPPTGSKRRPLRAKWKILRHNYNNNHPVIVVLRFNHEL